MIKRMSLKIFILGMGVSGLSLAKYLTREKIPNFCWDDDPKKRKKAAAKKLNLKNVSSKILQTCNLLVLSPGINHLKEDPHRAIVIANDLKIKIVTDLELLDILGFNNLMIGVTGTNGKSTTTHFINKTLSYNNLYQSKPCGNIGIPFTDLSINKETILIIEASSYQLAKIDKLKFNFAFLLNISKDHLDWHGSFKKYVDAKLRIFKNQNSKCYAIICIDDQYCEKVASNFRKNFSSKLILISCKKNKSADILLTKSPNKIEILNKLSQEKLEISLSKLKFTKAEHNFQNLLATYVSSYLMNQDKGAFLNSLVRLDNLKHRIEFAGKYKNITFYNDSKSTNVNSAKTAIESFENIFWILGGREKEGGLTGIEKNLSNILKAYSFGESGYKIKKFLNQNSICCLKFNTLEESFNKALHDAKKSKKNINILLSPACSSFDQFENFEQRGKKFKQLVKEKIKNYDGT